METQIEKRDRLGFEAHIWPKKKGQPKKVLKQ